MRPLCCCLMLITVCLNAQDTQTVPDPAEADGLIAALMANHELKAPGKIKIPFNGKLVYARYVSHSTELLTVRFRDEDIHYEWDSFASPDLLNVLNKFDFNGEASLLLARYCLEQHLPKEAKRYCAIAMRKNNELKQEAAALLEDIEQYEEDRKKSRYNHDNRKLPPLPDFDQAVLFNTPEADRIMASIQLFPKDNPWNQNITRHPVHPDSDSILNAIGKDKTIRYDLAHNFVIVPPGQPKVPIKITSHPNESSRGPAPIPENMPIEGWPKYWTNDVPALSDYQRASGGDRHGYIIDPWNNMLYEFFQLQKTNNGWQAACSVYWRLDKNEVRPDRWTSADAAGLSVLAGVIRYDELQRGRVEHAIRVTFSKTRKKYIYPASHYASDADDPSLPAMGQRFRLKKNIDTSGMSKQAMAIVYALQTYGAICADNGSDWYMSGVIDPRIDMSQLRVLQRIKGSDFEVIQTTPAP